MSYNQDDLNNFYSNEEKRVENQIREDLEKIRNVQSMQQAVQWNAPTNIQRTAPEGQRKKVLITIIALTMVAVLGLGILIGTLIMTQGKYKLLNDVSKLIDKYAIVEESDDPYAHDWYYQAAKAMLQSIDPYSTLLTPEEYYDLMNAVEMNEPENGTSYYLDKDNDYCVYEVIIQSPAYLAGVFPGDKVRQIAVYNNTTGTYDAAVNVTSSTPVNTFLSLIRNDKIKLYVQRDGDALGSYRSFELTKSYYQGESVEYYFAGIGVYSDFTNMSLAYRERIKYTEIPSNTGYIRVSTFMAAIDEINEYGPHIEFERAMAMFSTYSKKNLILDLRDNGGGVSSVASSIASYLIYDKSQPTATQLSTSVDRLRDGQLVSKNMTEVKFHLNFDKNFSKPPIVVLANGGSASASEMLLGALLDYGTCIHIGTTTYGKGIAQTVMDVGKKKTFTASDGKKVTYSYGAYFTIMKYYSPVYEKSIHGIGFTPSTGYNIQGYSAQMDAAISYFSSY